MRAVVELWLGIIYAGLIGSLDVEEVILIISHFRCKILYPLDYIIITMMLMMMMMLVLVLKMMTIRSR